MFYLYSGHFTIRVILSGQVVGYPIVTLMYAPYYNTNMSPERVMWRGTFDSGDVRYNPNWEVNPYPSENMYPLPGSNGNSSYYIDVSIPFQAVENFRPVYTDNVNEVRSETAYLFVSYIKPVFGATPTPDASIEFYWKAGDDFRFYNPLPVTSIQLATEVGAVSFTKRVV